MKSSLMILFTILIVISSFNFILAARPPLHDSSPSLLAEQPVKCPGNCNNNRGGSPRRPVCGSDSRTYTSMCHFRRAQCQQPSLNVKHRGKCKGPSDERSCFTDRKLHMSKRPSDSVPMFTPTCRSDGRYTPVQCFEVYCWCVDMRSGKPIPNTSLENARPNCNKATRRVNGDGKQKNRGNGGAGARNKNRQRACERLDRTKFNKNMLDTFKIEYRRLPHAAKPDLGGEVGDTENEIQQRLLEWKFSSLDINGDNQLDRHEYRGLRRLVRKVVQPRRCAKIFTKLCDTDSDEILSKDEWTDCLGLNLSIPLGLFFMLNASSADRSEAGDFFPQGDSDEEDLISQEVLRPALLPDGGAIGITSSFEEDPTLVSRGPPLKEDEAPEDHGCLVDRQTALDETNSNFNLYVPECTPDGRYQKTQCYKSTEYCFCVEEDTGKSIPGTSVKNGDPKCDSIIPPLRPMKGCPEPKKQIFLKNLMDYLMKKMPITILSTNGSESVQEDEEIRLPVISTESVATWHFRSLDVNRDKALARSEWKSFRTLVESQPSLRHCGRKLPRHCDVNRDLKISLTEWLLCLGVSGNNSNNNNRAVQGASTENPHRNGQNPMELLLKPEN